MKKYIFALLILCSCGGGGGGGSNSYTLTSEVSGLAFPARLEELPSGKLLIAEIATGNLSIYDRAAKTSKTIATFSRSDDASIAISGLLVDKNFNQNGFVFVYHGESASRLNVLTRLTLSSEQIVAANVIETFSAVGGHNGGGMYQFEDGNILLGTGDSGNPDQTQNLASKAGKLILLNQNGETINANYNLGLRNPFGLSGQDDQLFVLDNGPNCDDEINLVAINANYGWNNAYVCGLVEPLVTGPIFRWQQSEGTTDILYSQNSFFGGKLIAGRYNTKAISILSFDGRTAKEEQILFSDGAQGPIIDILETRNGEILLASQDGNIYRITN